MMVLSLSEKQHRPSKMNDKDCNAIIKQSIEIYESMRGEMPNFRNQKTDTVYEERLFDLLPRFDALFLDGYGVLNVGDEIISGVEPLINKTRELGIHCYVLTNGASKNTSFTQERYSKICPTTNDMSVISSRDAILDHLVNNVSDIAKVGIIDDFADIPQVTAPSFTRLSFETPSDWLQVEIIGFFGSVNWNDCWQKCLEQAINNGIKVLVANPDVVSPQKNGFSFEPGYWTNLAVKNTGISKNISWFGKPYKPIYELAIRKLQQRMELEGRTLDLTRTAVVGDSLHTDILGGNAAGLVSVLMTDYGIFRDGGFQYFIESTGIRPDYIVNRI